MPSPGPGGTQSSLAGIVAWLKNLGRAPQQQNKQPQRKGAPTASYSNNGYSGGVDLTQFADTFQPSGGMFAPNYPLTPPDQQQVRAFDYAVGYNTVFTPRSYESISFKELRALAENHAITRLAIETRKDQIEGLEWNIRPKDESNSTAEAQARADKLSEFWQKPDGETPFATWLRILVEEMLVTDAAALEVRFNRGGDIIGFDPIDGSSLKVLIDHTGRTPRPPAPAFEQVIHGRPWVLLEDGTKVNTDDPPAIRDDGTEAVFTTQQIIYAPRNPRVFKVYGCSPVEQCVIVINTAIRRELQQLQYFTEGNIPHGLLSAPAEWTPEQIKGFQDWFDSLLAGNTAQRTRLLWTPNGVKYTPFLVTPEKTIFDEWLARVICFAFSLPPNAFVERINRATAETAQEAALTEGLGPLLAWVKRLIDGIIQKRMGQPDLEFAWSTPNELDAKTLADIQVALVKEGIISRNEARDTLGYDPDPGADDLMVDTANGPVMLSDIKAISALAANPPMPPPNPQAQAQSGNAEASGAPGTSPKATPAKGEASTSKASAPTMSKDDANYLRHHPSDNDRCALCTMFVAPDACTLVRGVISPNGHCDYFEAKDG